MSRIVLLAVTLAFGLGLSACGKKGAPDYPAGTQMETVKQPDGSEKKRPVKPSRRFVLDGLLN